MNSAFALRALLVRYKQSCFSESYGFIRQCLLLMAAFVLSACTNQTRLSLKDDDAVQPFVSVSKGLEGNAVISAEIKQVNGEADQTVENSGINGFQIVDNVFLPTPVELNSEFKLDTLSLFYGYNVWSNDRFNLNLSGGLRKTRLNVDIQADGQSYRRKSDFTKLLGKATLQFNLNERFSLSYFYASTLVDYDVTADQGLNLSYSLNSNIQIVGGWFHFEQGELFDTTVDIDAKGFAMGLEFSL